MFNCYLNPINPTQISLNCLSLNFYTTLFPHVIYKHRVIKKSNDLFSEINIQNFLHLDYQN